ncbi:anti-sigma factor [Chryseobacterium sp. Ch-15]|uniref:Anti-sigma factor n=1 Tax=Chryseobacterium muglaense TaxID=2893752 RepID=A0A9Q3UXN0_9FLAO|nr:anti-sigma factor [Chryseobacterium muglaense]MBD3902984.1 anti-sigma factor [Chryseobacterium muglaense]MCC9035816.1 anti-sigma factor [Chryseobacterium muglaense]MCM2554455.1 anti-sigma factor [Chryseobacterium muglaense]
MDSKEYISSGILESYILGFASPEEAGILECVMKNNAEVKAAYEEAQKTFELLATAQAVTPPNDLKSKIWDKIQLEQEVVDEKPVVSINNVEPKVEIQQSRPEIRIEKNNSWKNYAVAASVLFLVSIAGNLYWMNSQKEIKNEIAVLKSEKQSHNLAMQNLEQKLQVTSNPNMLKIVLAGVEKHPTSNAVVYWDKTSKDVYLTANSLPKAPEGMQYQLWAIADGKPVSAGMYTDEKDAKIALANIPNAQAFAITLEKEGGSAAPTMENMYVMGGV